MFNRVVFERLLGVRGLVYSKNFSYPTEDSMFTEYKFFE